MIKKQISQLVQENKNFEAIQILERYPEARTEAIGLISRIDRLNKLQREGRIDDEAYEKRLTNLQFAILETAEDLDDTGATPYAGGRFSYVNLTIDLGRIFAWLPLEVGIKNVALGPLLLGVLLGAGVLASAIYFNTNPTFAQFMVRKAGYLEHNRFNTEIYGDPNPTDGDGKLVRLNGVEGDSTTFEVHPGESYQLKILSRDSEKGRVQNYQIQAKRYEDAVKIQPPIQSVDQSGKDQSIWVTVPKIGELDRIGIVIPVEVCRLDELSICNKSDQLLDTVQLVVIHPPVSSFAAQCVPPALASTVGAAGPDVEELESQNIEY